MPARLLADELAAREPARAKAADQAGAKGLGNPVRAAADSEPALSRNTRRPPRTWPGASGGFASAFRPCSASCAARGRRRFGAISVALCRELAEFHDRRGLSPIEPSTRRKRPPTTSAFMRRRRWIRESHTLAGRGSRGLAKTSAGRELLERGATREDLVAATRPERREAGPRVRVTLPMREAGGAPVEATRRCSRADAAGGQGAGEARDPARAVVRARRPSGHAPGRPRPSDCAALAASAAAAQHGRLRRGGDHG